MQSAPAAYHQGYVQGADTCSDILEYSTLQHLHWMVDVVSSRIIRQQVAQPSRSTEHHIYYHFVPMEPGARAYCPSPRTRHSFFSTPNWSNPSSTQSSPECRPTRLEMPSVSRASVASRRGAVSYNPPPPAYNAELQVKNLQRIHTPMQPAQVQVQHTDIQTQRTNVQDITNQLRTEFTGHEPALTPKEFIQKLERLIEGKNNRPHIHRFHIQGEVIPVSVWRPDQNGPFLVQHYSPNGQESVISVAHIVNECRIMWCPPPNIEYFRRE